MTFSGVDNLCQYLKIAKQFQLKTTTMKNNITTLDQMIEEHYGRKGSASRNEFEWGAQLFKISAMIKIARQNLKLTQREFAKKCNTSRYSISMAENNLAEIRISTLQKIVEFGLGGRLEINIEL
jgi:HTH-type transcriptional regulator / antitoxin HipB